MFAVPLKTNNRWTAKRGVRKVDTLVAPLQKYVRRHLQRTIGLGLGVVLCVALDSLFGVGMNKQADNQAQRAKRRFLERIRNAPSRGTNGKFTWTRDQLHERVR